MKVVILLRGINVGSTRSLPMRELTDILESIGFENVRTYIQSGNVVADAPRAGLTALGDKIGTAIEEKKRFRPSILILTVEEFRLAMSTNPFPEAEADPSRLHLFFLDSTPESPNLASMDAVKTHTERYVLDGKVMYFHAPDGMGNSRLGANAERYLGVAATARNWRTVVKLSDMAGLP